MLAAANPPALNQSMRRPPLRRNCLVTWGTLTCVREWATPRREPKTYPMQLLLTVRNGLPFPAIDYDGRVRTVAVVPSFGSWEVLPTYECDLLRVLVEPCTRLGAAIMREAESFEQQLGDTAEELLVLIAAAIETRDCQPLYRHLFALAGVDFVGDDCLDLWTSDHRVRQLLRVIEDFGDRENSHALLSMVSSDFGLSHSHFRALFHDHVGLSLRTYRRWHRTRKALPLLGTQAPLARIAATVGFSNISHFSRVFSEFFGCSPSRFRRIVQILG